MNRKHFILCLTACLFSLSLGNAYATSISLDGTFDTGEWDGHYVSDDGVGPNGYLGPGYGGQAFDAEYLGLKIEGSTLSFGLQTGLNLQNGAWSGGLHFAPGDFALDVNNDSIFDYAIDFSISGGDVTYSLLEVQSWQDVMYPQHGIANPFQYDEGTQVGDTFGGAYGSGVFANNADGGTSYVLEGSFDLALLALHTLGDPITLRWTMECGNDYVSITGDTASPTPTPEPATMLLVGTGLLGLAGVRRRMK